MSVPIRIALVDDHDVWRRGVMSHFRGHRDIKVVLEASNGVEFLEKLETTRVDVVLLDIEMPEMDGIETTVKLVKDYPDVKIIILSMHNKEEFVFNLMMKGAHGYIPKERGDEIVT